MNAQIGKNLNNKFCLHNLSNRNGEHLTDFTLENGLTSLNIKFQNRKGKLWAYTNANNAKAQIDYILMNKKWINRAFNCEAYSSFESVFSDHRIITANIPLSLRKNAAQTTKTAHYDWFLLKGKDICDKYTIALRNKSMHFRRSQKHLLRMTNMKTSSMPTWKRHQIAYQPK